MNETTTITASVDRAWQGRDIISLRTFSRQDIEAVLERAETLASQPRASLSGCVMASLFFEPSTRTQLSFDSAMKRLGGQSIGFSGSEGTSVTKGETLGDTVRTVERYSNVIVIRHPLEGSAQYVADSVNIPVINAGDGANQHPTQTLLDLYTLRELRGTLDGLKIGLVGDLKYGRTVHSLVTALTRFEKIELRLIAPELLRLPASLREMLDASTNVQCDETTELHIEGLDAVYMTRIQRERFTDLDEYRKVQALYELKAEDLVAARETSILHPLPRLNEIATSVDALPQARYFQQVGSGIPVRMALLEMVLKG